MYLTVVFKIQLHSRRYEHAFDSMMIYNTRFARRVTEALRETSEEPGESSSDGRPRIFDLIATVLRKRQTGEAKGKIPRLLANELSVFVNSVLREPGDEAFSTHMREGFYSKCAVMLMNWCANFVPELDEQNKAIWQLLTEQIDALPPVPSTDDLRARWLVRIQQYERDLEEQMPFGKQEGEPLERVGKRDLRWLHERLLTEAQIETCLDATEILLGIKPYETSAELDRAKLTPHPYLKRTKRQRGVRMQLSQTYIPPVAGNTVYLGELLPEQLDHFRNDVLDQQYRRETYEQIRASVERLLNERPPGYPTIKPLQMPNADPRTSNGTRPFAQALKRLAGYYPARASARPKSKKGKNAGDDEYTDEELRAIESNARDEVNRTAHELHPYTFPVHFKRTTIPGSNTNTFSLLYDYRTEAYVLALSFQGQRLDPAIGKFTPQVGPYLHYINYPGMPFKAPLQTSMLLCSLEYAEDYQGRILRRYRRERAHVQVDTRQLAAEVEQRVADALEQHQQKVNQKEQKPRSRPETVQQREQREQKEAAQRDVLQTRLETRAWKQVLATELAKLGKVDKEHTIAELTITCDLDRAGNLAYYAHLPVPLRVEACRVLPACVLGIHEHATGYSYALLSLAGDVLDVGDLAIYHGVLPVEGDTTYNPNYADEVAHAIVTLAARHNAVIGIEDTSYLRTISTSRTRNRRVLGRPSATVFKTVAYKADAAIISLKQRRRPPHIRAGTVSRKRPHRYRAAPVTGMLPPQEIGNISPPSDCSACMTRLPEKKKGTRQQLFVTCPTCKNRQVFEQTDDYVQECQQAACQTIWRPDAIWIDEEFVCPLCDAPPRLARFNTAILVAQQTLAHLEWVSNKQKAT
jgi:hypothetical protein